MSADPRGPSGTGHDRPHEDGCGCFDCRPPGAGFPKRPAEPRVTEAAPAPPGPASVSPADPRKIGSADVAHAGELAHDALREYAKALAFWNAPDDEHTRFSLRRLTEEIIEEVVPGGR